MPQTVANVSVAFIVVILLSALLSDATPDPFIDKIVGRELPGPMDNAVWQVDAECRNFGHKGILTTTEANHFELFKKKLGKDCGYKYCSGIIVGVGGVVQSFQHANGITKLTVINIKIKVRTTHIYCEKLICTITHRLLRSSADPSRPCSINHDHDRHSEISYHNFARYQLYESDQLYVGQAFDDSHSRPSVPVSSCNAFAILGGWLHEHEDDDERNRGIAPGTRLDLDRFDHRIDRSVDLRIRMALVGYLTREAASGSQPGVIVDRETGRL